MSAIWMEVVVGGIDGKQAGVGQEPSFASLLQERTLQINGDTNG